MRKYLFIAALAVLAGCSYDPAFGDLTCEEEGATRDGQRCYQGVWVVADVGPADTGDAGGQDEPDGTDQPDGTCEAESDTEFCARLQKNCGTVSDVDNCGADRDADCGTCSGEFDSCEDNVCVPDAESDEELCDAAGATCGTITATDRTGAERMPDCGTCMDPLECGVGTSPNQCGCVDADDEQFCIDNGDPECGMVTALDPICGVERTVNCGTCMAPDMCTNGVCVCNESDDDFCARLGADCGPVTADDLCGVSRATDCGTCTSPESCGGGPAGMQGVCGCDVADACAALGSECGTTDVSSVCVNLTDVECGSCGAEGVCAVAMNSCACNAGYAYDGAICSDIDECSDGTDQCDPNAMCTNTDGFYDCDCIPPYTGDGFTCQMAVPPVIEEFVVDTAELGDLQTPQMTAVDDQLYVALVSIRTDDFEVNDVTGLGLNWQRAGQHCDSSDGQIIEVWWARGSTSADSVIDVELTGAAYAAATVVYRISGAPASGNPGVTVLRNANGVDGDCDSGSVDAGYSFPYTPTSANTLVLVGVATRGADHTEGAVWTEDDELSRRALGRTAGLAAMHYANTGSTAFTVAGSFNPDTNWALALFEVLPQ